MDIGPGLQRIALELYAHGYYPTRDDALIAALEDPEHARTLLALYHQGPEMHHPDDRAAIDGPDGWGHADTGGST
jgi:hypothetical protein